jgi:hypothetical protein
VVAAVKSVSESFNIIFAHLEKECENSLSQGDRGTACERLKASFNKAIHDFSKALEGVDDKHLQLLKKNLSTFPERFSRCDDLGKIVLTIQAFENTILAQIDAIVQEVEAKSKQDDPKISNEEMFQFMETQLDRASCDLLRQTWKGQDKTTPYKVNLAKAALASIKWNDFFVFVAIIPERDIRQALLKSVLGKLAPALFNSYIARYVFFTKCPTAALRIANSVPKDVDAHLAHFAKCCSIQKSVDSSQ